MCGHWWWQVNEMELEADADEQLRSTARRDLDRVAAELQSAAETVAPTLPDLIGVSIPPELASQVVRKCAFLGHISTLSA